MTGNGFYIPPIKMVIFLGDGVFMALGITHILQLFFLSSLADCPYSFGNTWNSYVSYRQKLKIIYNWWRTSSNLVN